MLRYCDIPYIIQLVRHGNAREGNRGKKKLSRPKIAVFTLWKKARKGCNSYHPCPHPHHPQTSIHLLSSHLFSPSQIHLPAVPVCQNQRCYKLCNKLHSVKPSTWHNLFYCLENGKLKRIMGDVASCETPRLSFHRFAAGRVSGSFWTELSKLVVMLSFTWRFEMREPRREVDGCF
jgi:hypothetical protein